MINAQEYLNQNYPKDIKELDISNQNLEGKLTIKDFPNLESIKCGKNGMNYRECSELGGVGASPCANGFGVCCICK